MKIKSLVKGVIALAVLSGAAAGANAATFALGLATPSDPLEFNGLVSPAGPFTDIFTFSLPSNGGSTYSVINFPAAPLFNTVFSAAAVFSNADGILFNGDDQLLGSTSTGGDSLSLGIGPTSLGSYYLSVTGIANGTVGGLYKGTISVTAVPEPESYAMLLAGLGVMGAIAMRRNKSKSK